jgi:hypothetical protein
MRGGPPKRMYHGAMKVTAQVAMWGCAAFALLCFGFAISGFSALDTIIDAAERDLSQGYAWFWTFLAAVASVFGILSWMIKEGKLGNPEQM